MRPGAWYPIAPRLDCTRVDDWRRFLLAVGLGDVDHVGVTIPCQIDRSERMIPTEIYPVDLHPFLRDGNNVADDLFISDWEHAARTKRGNALDARFPLMWRIAGNDRGALFWRVVFGVV